MSISNPKIRQPKVKVAKTEPAASIDRSPVPERPKAVVMAKHIRPEAREAEANVPLPVPRPAIPSGSPAPTSDASMPTASGSHGSPHKLVEAAAVRRTDIEPAAPDGQVSPPPAGGRAAPEIRGPRTEPSRAGDPTRVAATPPPAASPLPEAPRVAAITPADHAHEPPVDAKASPPLPPSVDGRGGEPVSDPGTAGTRLPNRVASLPPPVDAGSSPREADHPVGSSQRISFQPLAELGGASSPVTIGQVSSELRGTDVHVVVVNILHGEMKDVDVLCRARDGRGLQVAEASAHIASIAPSDVAFGQVVFPPDTASRDDEFTCRIGRIAAASDATP